MTTSLMGRDFEVHKNHMADMTWQVLKVDKDGNAKVRVAFTGVKMVVDSPMGRIEVDSNKPKDFDDILGKTLTKQVNTIAGIEMTFTTDGTGEIKDVQVPEKVKNSLKNLSGTEAMGEMFSDEGLKKMTQGGIVLPKEAVTKGKTWSQKTDTKIAMGRLKGDMRCTYEGTVEIDGKKLEKIAIKPNITLEPAPNAKLQMKLANLQGKGYVYIDNEAGRMAEMTLNQIMETAMQAANTDITMKMDENTTMKLAK
jgi:hypothetical protein